MLSLYLMTTHTQIVIENSLSTHPNSSLGHMAPSDWQGKCVCCARTNCEELPSLRATTKHVCGTFLSGWTWKDNGVKNAFLVLTYIIPFHWSIVNQSYILMNIKREQRTWKTRKNSYRIRFLSTTDVHTLTTLSSGFIDDEIIERVMLEKSGERICC